MAMLKPLSEWSIQTTDALLNGPLPMKKLLLGLTLLCCNTFAQTTIADKFPLGAANLPWYASLTISWPAYTPAQGQAVAAGTQTVLIANDGSFTVQLPPSDTATPPFQYTVQYHLQNGTAGPSVQWLVPTTTTAASVDLPQVQSTQGTVRTSLMLTQVRCPSCTNGDIPAFNGSQFQPVSVSAFEPAGSASAVLGASVQKTANLADVANRATALTNLGGVTAAQAAAAAPVQSVNGQSGAVIVASSSAPPAGLVKSNGSLLQTAVAGTDYDAGGTAAAVQTFAANASNLASGTVALSRLPTIPSTQISGLGTASTQASTAFDTAGAAATAQAASTQKSANLTDLASPSTALTNLGGVTAAQAAAAAPVQSVAGVSPASGNVAVASTNLSDSTNLVRTNTTTPQALQGSVTAPQINHVFYVDGYPSSGCIVGSTTYTTQYDCAKATGAAWVVANKLNALLVLGVGTYSACADIPLPNIATQKTLSMRGMGYWQSTIQQDCAITHAMSYLADPVSSSVGTQVEVTGLRFNAHSNAPSCGAWYGAYQSLFTHLSCLGWTGGQYAFQWGDTTAGGNDGNLIVEDITAITVGGASLMGTSTATFSAGTITLNVTTGGSGYGGTSATVWILGAGNVASGGKWPCATMPTNFTVPVSGGALTTGTYTAAAAGCVSTLYSQVQNTPNTNYILDFQNVFDSTVKDITPVGVANIASIRFKGGAIMSYHAHPYSGQIVGLVDYGGDVIDGYESDSPGAYGLDLEGSSTIVKGMARVWDGFGPYAGSQDLFIDTAANVSNIQLQSGECYSNQTAGGYTALVDSTGSDLSLNNTYVNVSISNWQLCSVGSTQQTTWQGNARLYGNQFTFFGSNNLNPVQWQLQSQYAGSHTWQFGMTAGTTSNLFFTDATNAVTPLQISSSGIQVGAAGSTIAQIKYYSTASITPASVAAQSCADQNFTATGLRAGDKLSQIVPSGALGNVSVTGYVTISDTLTLHFCNASTAIVTPPVGVYQVAGSR
jgi:hypothetical protein